MLFTGGLRGALEVLLFVVCCFVPEVHLRFFLLSEV